MVEEKRVSLKFVSRGSELLAELELHEKQKQDKREEQILNNIQSRIDKIKEIKQHNVNFVEPGDHGTAIGNGDYYMFDDSEDEQVEDVTYREISDFTQDQKSKEMKRLSQKITLGRVSGIFLIKISIVLKFSLNFLLPKEGECKIL